MATATPATAAAPNQQIVCKECGARVHAIHIHLRDDHGPNSAHPMTVAEYQAKHPGEPMYSEVAKAAIAKKQAETAAASALAAQSVAAHTLSAGASTKKAFHELFELPEGPATLSAKGNPIPITVCAPAAEHLTMIPAVDPNYVFNIDKLKTLLMGIEMRIPAYVWGHSGVGKTTVLEQIAAFTRRPFCRVQHTANMEEEHVVGGWRLRDGQTVFELGPLANAMRYGWMYVADEYDFGRPEVTSLYQAVLEGKPLSIKEADAANRVIHPHPDFRILATGNTNGQGDETGLYAGTTLQNAANYERFGIVERMDYMDKALEERLVSQQASIPMKDAKQLVDFATRIREQFDGGQIGNPISPRSLIYAAKLGVGKRDYKVGLDLAFINRLASTDREAAKQVAQRVFA